MNTLASMGVEYQNDIKITMLLAGLRSEYKQVINILNMTPWLTYDEVYSQLKLFEENNNIDRKMARSFRGLSLNQTRSNRPRPRRQRGLSAQSSRGNQRAQGYQSSRQRRGSRPTHRRSNNNKRCFNCGRTGHFEKECRSPCKICKSTEHTRYSCPQKHRRKEHKHNGYVAHQAQAADNLEFGQEFPALLPSSSESNTLDHKGYVITMGPGQEANESAPQDAKGSHPSQGDEPAHSQEQNILDTGQECRTPMHADMKITAGQELTPRTVDYSQDWIAQKRKYTANRSHGSAGSLRSTERCARWQDCAGSLRSRE